MIYTMRVWPRKRDGLWGQHLSPSAFVPAEVDADYFSSEIHYKAIARRIIATLRCGGRFVLITGDPPASAQALSEALRRVAGDRYDVITICCEPDLADEQLERILANPTTREATVGGSIVPSLSITSSLFVFDGFERLPDNQIEQICGGTPRRGEIRGPGILLASSGFLSRLERDSLQVLRDCLAGRFRLQEVDDDEAVGFLHTQLFAQRDRRIEARGFRRGIFIGLTAGGVTLAGSIGTFLALHRTTESVTASENIKENGSTSENALILQPAPKMIGSIERREAAQDTQTIPALTAASPPVYSTLVEGPPRSTPPAVTDTSAEPQPSTPEITALVKRGDAFLSSGDITSARLFYERAADAGSGLAALQLGATFDPLVLGRSGLRGSIMDQAQALSWYRRARDLGVAEAERQIERLELRPGNALDTRSR